MNQPASWPELITSILPAALTTPTHTLPSEGGYTKLPNRDLAFVVDL